MRLLPALTLAHRTRAPLQRMDQARPTPQPPRSSEEKGVLRARRRDVAEHHFVRAHARRNWSWSRRGFADGALGKAAEGRPAAVFPEAAGTAERRARRLRARQCSTRPPLRRVRSAPPRAWSSRPLKEGTGASPKATDTVKVHYHGTLPNGKVFDSSRRARRAGDVPAERRDQVLDRRRAADEGRRQEQARVSGRHRLRRSRRAGARFRPGATLIFEVELLDISKPAAAPADKKG